MVHLSRKAEKKQHSDIFSVATDGFIYQVWRIGSSSNASENSVVPENFLRQRRCPTAPPWDGPNLANGKEFTPFFEQ